jgi:hypothetical protein
MYQPGSPACDGVLVAPITAQMALTPAIRAGVILMLMPMISLSYSADAQARWEPQAKRG